MAVLGVAAAALAGTLALVGDVQGADGSQWRLHALFFVFGGLAFSVYPLCVAHLLDHLPPDDLLAGCSSLLLFRSEEHPSELQSLMRISYAVFCLKKKIYDYT